MTVSTCGCGGCIGMGPCDDGTPCSHGCGARASTRYGTCQSCEDELTGRDMGPYDDEDDY